jgi:hypothetical protein
MANISGYASIWLRPEGLAGLAARVPNRDASERGVWTRKADLMNTAELELESAELLPDRQALCCWKWSPCGHEASSCNSWDWSWHCAPTQSWCGW